MNPVEHIRFVLRRIGPAGSPRRWWALPRNSSLLGNWTIQVCGLNEGELAELRGDHVDNVVCRQVQSIKEAIIASDVGRIDREFDRAMSMLGPKNPYVALTYDAFMHFLPDAVIRTVGKRWPLPTEVGVPRRSV